MSITGSLAILNYVVKNHDSTMSDLHRHLHLIDQNILTASMTEEGQIIDISNALCRYLNTKKNEIIGESFDRFFDDSQEELKNEIWKTIQTGSKWEGEVERCEDRFGDQWISLRIHPVFDGTFRIKSYTFFIQDITDKKVVEALSITDTLTELYNRRYYDEIIEREIEISKRNKSFLTLAILDIDFFKKYNDCYGHPAGDNVLVNVARVLRRNCRRPSDYLFRLGGEEFGILFSGSDTDNSRLFLEQIRKSIGELKITHDHNAVSKYVSVSIGAWVSKGDKIPDKNRLYILADEILYEAKNDRNKVIVRG